MKATSKELKKKMSDNNSKDYNFDHFWKSIAAIIGNVFIGYTLATQTIKYADILAFPPAYGYMEANELRIKRTHHPKNNTSLPVISVRGLDYLLQENSSGEPVLKKIKPGEYNPPIDN
jgi:hypothetical protein